MYTICSYVKRYVSFDIVLNLSAHSFKPVNWIWIGYFSTCRFLTVLFLFIFNVILNIFSYIFCNNNPWVQFLKYQYMCIFIGCFAVLSQKLYFGQIETQTAYCSEFDFRHLFCNFFSCFLVSERIFTIAIIISIMKVRNI